VGQEVLCAVGDRVEHVLGCALTRKQLVLGLVLILAPIHRVFPRNIRHSRNIHSRIENLRGAELFDAWPARFVGGDLVQSQVVMLGRGARRLAFNSQTGY
jgi:hypothetical protein